jgi:hypothetical protein
MSLPDNTEGDLAAACTWQIPEKPNLNTLPAKADAGSARHLETPAHASPCAPNASPAPNGGSPQAQKQRKAAAEEFPIRLSINITHAMNDALERMRRRTRLKQAVVARLGLMDYLARHDPQYRETD